MSRKSAYDLKIKNRKRKRSHERNGIGVRRIRKTFPFSPNSTYDLMKTRLHHSRKQKRKDKPITMHIPT